MDLVERIYQALRQHLGKEREEAVLRATAQRIASLWQKNRGLSRSSGSTAKAEPPQMDQGPGEEVIDRENDAVTFSEAESGTGDI